MVTIHPTRERRNYLLVSSDETDRVAARREIAHWAAERHLPLPARPRRLALVEENRLVAEWVVIERVQDTEPMPPGMGFCKGWHLVNGGRAA